MNNVKTEELPEACAVLPSEDGKRVSNDGVTITREGSSITIDVRSLEPPQPLVNILQLLESPDVSDTVLVLHDRDPLLLYPELEERNWSWEEVPSPQGELHLNLKRLSVDQG